ncbi:hypothetical protein PVK06_017488 [Gossypium arboreum]|uniref:Uncharacterized protein n=1 Tax=Gossypium arboreum TaxID=29729 RepID=A0ABR0Q2S6_GOSAR|nr:hypothetical protein PVK06_017488 [Gossypium arboreum]
MDTILRSDNSRMHPIRILGESQHLAREGAIGSGRTDEHWLTFHVQYINIWNNRYEFLSIREAIFAPKLVCYPEHMPWLRDHGKLYLLGEDVRVTAYEEATTDA